MPKFYCVSVGAGAGDNITLGAIRALEKTDVIFAPVKISGASSTALEIIGKEFDTAEKEIVYLEFPMKKTEKERKIFRKKAAEKIISALTENKTAAMITLGDVSVYSTAAYMAGDVKNAGFETEIIAGVPSFIAAADKACIALCEGNGSFAVIPSFDREKTEKYADDFDTLVIMKAGKNLDALCEIAEKYSLSGTVCSDIGMDGEKIMPLSRGMERGYFTTVILRKHIDKTELK